MIFLLKLYNRIIQNMCAMHFIFILPFMIQRQNSACCYLSIFFLYRDVIVGIYVVLLNVPLTVFNLCSGIFQSIVSTCHPVSLNVAMYDILSVFIAPNKKYLVMINERTTYNKSGHVSCVSFEYTTMYRTTCLI